MKIADVRVLVTSPGRNFVTVKVTTDDGLTGVGDATLNGRELAVATYLTEHVRPLLLGRDAGRIEDTWQYLYRGAYWRRGPVTMTAIAGIDTALWDIKAKAAGLPLYELLGGRSRDRVMVYGHAQGASIDDTVAQVGQFLQRGYRAVRAQTAVPGTRGTYGIGSDGERYEPASTGLPEETLWSTPAYLNHTPELFAAVRDAHGFDFHLLHDVHHRLTPIEAAGLGKAVEPYRLFCLEDPTPAEDQSAFRVIRQHTTTPIATGEVFNSVYDCQQLVTERLIDYVRASVTHAGGVTHLRRIFALAELYGVRSGSHGATDLSPVCLAAALHLDTTIPNFGIQEYMPHTTATDEVFPHTYRFEDGHLHPGEEPGLGVDIDEDAAAEYPYQPAYLPVARLADGSMHDW
ncbi:MAG: D-galactonate dehydratase family protein [Streptosporangiales bacterium]|nr:D-galactonate dehydratase family protein [Streptosporangiales bacterium]